MVLWSCPSRTIAVCFRSSAAFPASFLRSITWRRSTSSWLRPTPSSHRALKQLLWKNKQFAGTTGELCQECVHGRHSVLINIPRQIFSQSFGISTWKTRLGKFPFDFRGDPSPRRRKLIVVFRLKKINFAELRNIKTGQKSKCSWLLRFPALKIPPYNLFRVAWIFMIFFSCFRWFECAHSPSFVTLNKPLRSPFLCLHHAYTEQ